MVQLWILCRLAEKRTIFALFDPSAPPPLNWSITKFLLKVILTQIYLIRRQADPIGHTGAILVSIERSKQILVFGEKIENPPENHIFGAVGKLIVAEKSILS